MGIVNKKEFLMATRSVIGVMHGDVCKAVYCHWDGYLDHNGVILLEHYDSVKANHLVSLGDISSLGEEIGEKHPFSYIGVMDVKEYEDKYGRMTTFYGRDRDEENVSWKTMTNWSQFEDFFNGCGAEYAYIMRDGVWYVKQYSGELELLAEVLEKQQVSAD
jgi:hypothetical protein